MTLLNWLKQNAANPILTIQSLNGLTRCAQQVELQNGECFILHQQTDRATHFGIDYYAEAQILRAIESLNIAPVVHYCNEQGGILSWLEGKVLTKFTDELIVQLAKLLTQLHSFDYKEKKLQKLDLTERCQFIWCNLPKAIRQIHSAPNLPQIPPFTVALCHMDLHLGNILKTENKLKLIDWEFAAVSDPALDIAMLFHDEKLTTSQKTLFLEEYCNAMKFDVHLFYQKIRQYDVVIDELNHLWALVDSAFR